MLDAVLRFLGFGLCHQLPERSFFGGGVQVPVCARDTGIYVGFVVALIVIALLDRGRRRSQTPPAWLLAVAILFLLAMAWDGITSYTGLRVTTNEIRLATGLAAGFALAIVVAPILNGQLWRGGSPGRLLGRLPEAIAWLLALPVTYAVVLWGGPLIGLWYPVVVGASILATFTTVNLVVVALIPRFEHAAGSVSELLPPVAISLAATIAEIALADALRIALLRWVGRG